MHRNERAGREDCCTFVAIREDPGGGTVDSTSPEEEKKDGGVGAVIDIPGCVGAIAISTERVQEEIGTRCGSIHKILKLPIELGVEALKTPGSLGIWG